MIPPAPKPTPREIIIARNGGRMRLPGTPRPRPQRGAASWDVVAVWTLGTAAVLALWVYVGAGVMSWIGLQTSVVILNVVEVLGILVGLYSAVALFVWVTRPEPIRHPRDERGATDGVGLAIAGALLVVAGLLGVLFALAGRA